MGKTIALDFDGVLHAYREGWAGGKIYDRPVEGAQRAVKELLDAGFTLVIHTCRINPNPEENWTTEEPQIRAAAIRTWLINYNFPLDWSTEVEIHPKPTAFVYIDDRALRFTGEGSWPDVVRRFI